MPVEFIGLIRTKPASELNSTTSTLGDDIIDPAYVREFAKAHEQADFDKVLIGYSSNSPDGFTVASFAAAATERLGFLIAHRPGFVAPTLAARKAATLDHFTNGRIAIHIITGGSDVDQQKDGDWLDHDNRYRRTDEYLEIVRRTWTSDTPFDYEGEFYRVKDAFSAIKPLQKPHIPLYFGGASSPAVKVGAKHSDVYALWGEPIAAVKERIAEVRAALPSGRSIRFSVSLRPILGATEQEAWEKAHSILAKIQELRGGAKIAPTARPQAVGSQRLLDFAAQKEVYDKRLWTPIAAATGAAGNTTALVGTPEQVAEALIDYYDAGVTTLLIRGFDPLEDAIAYGRDVIPLVRKEVARRDQQVVAAKS
ncbi:luciferase family protein [Nostoc linckia NIES-25]|nr:luciferase family protein [Nostoc linckia NIES-25]